MNTLNSFLDYCKNRNIKLTNAQIVASRALFNISTGCGKTTLTSLLYAFDVASRVVSENIATEHGEALSLLKNIENHCLKHRLPRNKPYPGQVSMVDKYQQPIVNQPPENDYENIKTVL